MSAFQVGYELSGGLRRKSATLLCFVLASAMVMGVTTYVDSFSIHEWDTVIDIGSIAMTVESGSTDIANRVANIEGVEKVATIDVSSGSVSLANTTSYDQWGGSVVSLSAEIFTEFPDAFVLNDGRFPVSDSEIALHASVAKEIGAQTGDIVNYTLWGFGIQFSLLQLVGVFGNPGIWGDSSHYYYYTYYIAVVVPSLLDSTSLRVTTILDVDRSRVNAYDTSSSLSFLAGIEESIRRLDPSYVPPYGSSYYVYDLLGEAVNSYVSWKMSARLSQVSRGGGVVLLIGLVCFLAIRFNVNDRRYESTMLVSRGASPSDIRHIALRELTGITIVGIVVGLGVGLLISRLACAATGFFEFSLSLIWEEPFLVSIESIFFSVLAGGLIPPVVFLAYRMVYSTKKSVELETSRLARVSRLFRFIRWDFLIVMLASLLMVAMYSSGLVVQTNPVLYAISGFAPFALFLGASSLVMKAFRRGANRLSRAMSLLTGYVPSMVGVRRIGKSASSAAPVAVVLVLAISLAWGSAAVGASMPVTKMNQAKFAFGADLTFHLDSLDHDQWDQFFTNVTLHPQVKACTKLSVVSATLGMSWMDYEGVSLVAMNPVEYMAVGYDYQGSPLNTSPLREPLLTLGSVSSGAIVSADIATDYALEEGDTIRAFDQSTGEATIITFTVVAIAEALSDGLLLDTGYETPYYGPIVFLDGYYYWGSMEVGKNTIWVNAAFVESQLNLTHSAENLYCVRTAEGANSTAVGQSLLDSGGVDVITGDEWASVTKEVSSYVQQTSYRMDRSVDTMMTVMLIATISGGFLLYASEDIQARRREVALMRAMGSDRRLIVKTQGAEMIVLALSSIVLLTLFAPVLVTNLLVGYHISYYVFPAGVTTVLPWVQMIVVFLVFLGSITVFALLAALLSSRVNLASALNAAWAEAGPYGGEL